MATAQTILTPIEQLTERLLSEGAIGFGPAARMLGEFGTGKGTHPAP